jgi:uncharacterized protein (DUF488 family)
MRLGTRNAIQFVFARTDSMTDASFATSRLFTIGHSNLELRDFLGALVRQEISVLCDVRSRPGSFRFPQFNRGPLEAQLATAKIRYEYLGERLGGRPNDPQYYLPDGQADYAARRRAPDFQENVEQVLALCRKHATALMCAEEDPLHCHRFLLICPALTARGIAPIHLRRGGAPESQGDAEDRLLELHGFADVTSDSLFAQGREAALEDALRLQAERYAFRTSPEAIEYF